jgi:serine/arginine repetitive matrix protein 2
MKRDANGEEKERTPVPDPAASLRDIKPSPEQNHVPKFPELDPSIRRGPETAEKVESKGVATDVAMTDVPDENSVQEAHLHLSSDEDDDMDLDEEDFAEYVARFMEKKRLLQVQLESLRDEYQDAADVIDELFVFIEVATIEPELLPARTPPPEVLATTGADSNAPATPVSNAQGKDGEDIDMKDSSPEPYASPDFEALPYLSHRLPTPLSNPDQNNNDADDIALPLREKLQQIEEEEMKRQEELREEFVDRYSKWRKDTEVLSRTRNASEPIVEPPAAPISIPAAVSPTPVPTTESGRRALKYSSELELERALAESLKEAEQKAAEEQRKAKGQVNPEREAEVPAQRPAYEREVRTFKDTSMLRDSSDILRIFEFAPPEDTFTEKEDEILRIAYAQNMKMWIKISDVVGRSPKECIYHYYATKWDKPYKKSAGKRGKARGPKKGLVRKKLETEQPQDQPMTESGRPRRAAAPKFMTSAQNGRNDIDGDQEPLPAAGRRSATKDDGANAEDRPGRRGRVAREKGTRKPRNQPLVAKGQGAPSPVKVTREKKEKMPPLEVEGVQPWPAVVQEQVTQERVMPALLPIQGQPYLEQPQQPLYPSKSEMLMTAAPATVERPRSHSNTAQRQGASSYWSVTEEQDFKACLAYFGTDFQSIANHMGSKTQTMVSSAETLDLATF